MATKKNAAKKPAKNKKPAAKSAKKAPAKKPAAKAKPAKASPAKPKKAVTGKKPPASKKPNIKSKTVKKSTSKTVKAKPSPAKKAPAKKAAPAKKVVAKAPVAKKAAPAPKKELVKKPVPVVKQAPAPKPVKVRKAPVVKTPTKTVTTFAKTAIPGRTSTSEAAIAARSAAAAPATKSAPTGRAAREEKKPGVVVARRVLENKSKKKEHGKTMINYQPEYNRSILDEPEMTEGPVYRYSDEELNEFKDLIVNRLDAARKELVYLQGLITRKDEAGTEDTENRYMNMEDGSGAMEREQLAQLASRQIQFINHLEKAQIRIENKTYGICRVTGKLIDKARLRAVPHATLSIEAKKLMANK